MEGFVSLLLFAGFFYLVMRFGCGAHLVHGHGAHEPTRDDVPGPASERPSGRRGAPHEAADVKTGVR